MLSLIVLAIGLIMYAIAYISPRTDIILYIISGIFFIFAGFLGLAGHGDIQTGTEIIKTTDTTYTVFPVYSGLDFFNSYLPIVEILIGIYLIFNGAIANGRGTESASKS